MSRLTCFAVRRQLGAFVDNELTGVERLRTTRHLESCAACAADLDAYRDVGELLRASAALYPSPAMSGLADGVLTRVRAEQAQSWRATMRRGVDSWHWAIVGVGSVTATSFVTLVVAVVLAFGPKPVRADSLAAVFNDIGARPSFVVLEDLGESQRERLDRVVAGRGQQGSRGTALATFLSPSEHTLVAALSEQLAREGGVVDLQRMNDDDRERAGALLGSISEIRKTQLRAYLLETVTVNASGL